MSEVTIVRVSQATVARFSTRSVIASLRVSGGIVGPRGPRGLSGGELAAYTHHQGVAAFVWVVNHGMSFNPNVNAYDSSGDQIEGDVDYISPDQLTITYEREVSGEAYLS